ncbi:MAG: phytanoyl-CoA dioxygenase family protein, partial [Xanthomonadaceae bacterium]|nr:phytanoyl-CoA dioxygenase family protein [Xanthomonadaceae bacterium]
MTRIDRDMAAASFASNGYLVVPGLCGEAILERMRRQVLKDLDAAVGPVEYEAEVGYPGAPAQRTAPGGQTIRRLRDAIARDAVFLQWALSETLTEWARLLLARRDIRLVRAHHNCIMTKHPDFSSATGWHQDTRYWSYRRADLVNAWTALGHESADNGGMRVIPGSHRQVFGSGCFDGEQFFRDDLAANRALIARAVQIDLAPGDVL